MAAKSACNRREASMENQQFYVSFKSGPLGPEDLKTSPLKSHGAVCVFEGRVRDQNMGRTVTMLSYDINQQLAKKIILEICYEAVERFNCPKAHITVSHSWGDLKVGDISVIIRVGTAHRREAFDIAQYTIDELKHRSPIWKKEYYTDGDSGWLEGHALCKLSHSAPHSDSSVPG